MKVVCRHLSLSCDLPNRYVGPTEIAEGVWVGIEGDQTIPSGNDGTHKFKR